TTWSRDNGAAVSLTVETMPSNGMSGKMQREGNGFDIKEIASRLPVSLDHVVVKNASLSLSMPAYRTDISIRDISMDTYPDIGDGRVSGSMEMRDATLSKSGTSFTVTALKQPVGLDDRNISLSSLSLYSDHIRLSASGRIKDYDNPWLDLHFTASVDHIEGLNHVLKTVPVSLPYLSGSYSLDGGIKGNLLDPSSAGRLDFTDMVIGGIRGGSGRISYLFKSDRLFIKKGDVDIAGGRVRFNGDIDLSNDRLPASMSLELTNISFGGLLDALTVSGPYVDGSITGKVSVNGTFNPIYLSGGSDVLFKRFSVYDGPFNGKSRHTIMVVEPVHVRTGVIFTNNCAYITDTTVQTARSLIHTYTALYFTGAMFLTFDSDRVDMEDVSPIADIPYTGVGSVRGAIAGPFTDIAIHGDTAFHGFSMEHIKLGDVTGGISFRKDTLSLTSVKAVTGKSDLYVDGGIRFTDEVGLHFGVKFAPLAVGDIAQNAGITLSTGGSITGSARIDGPVLGMNGSVDLHFLRPDFYWQSFDGGDVRLLMHDGIFRLAGAEFTKGNSRLRISGSIAENGDVDIGFSSEGFNAGDIDPVVRSGVPLRALVMFKGNISGTTYDPSGNVSIEVKDTSYNGSRVPDASASLYFSHDVLSAASDLFDGSIGLSAKLDLSGGYPFEMEARFRRFNALPLASAFSGAGMTSDVTGKLWLVGRLDNMPDSLVGYMYLTTIAMGAQYAVLHNRAPVFVDIAKDNVYFRNFTVIGKNSLLKIGGFYSLKGSIDLLIDADVDLGYMPVLTDIVAGATGSLKLNTRIYGRGNNIILDGRAELNGDATFAEVPITLSGVHMSVVMANNNIIVKDLTGNINSGTMHGGGRIITAGLLPNIFSLSLSFKNMGFVYHNTVPLQLDGELGIKGNYPSPVLEGNIKVVNAVYTDYINWEDQMLKFQHRRYEPKGIERKGGHPLRLNIGVDADNSIVIDNNIINSVLSAQLKVMGNVDAPVIVGNISTNEGKIYYRSTTFAIDEALVTYAHEHPHNPFVDLRASTSQQFLVNGEYTDYKIYLTIAGELDKLNINLTSSPPNLDEMDIISLLTYGVTPSDLMKNGVSSAAAYEVGTAVGSKLAKDIFSDIMGSENLNKFRKMFWVDNLQIEPYYPLGEPSSSIRLIVTKRISNDFDILYSNDLSGYNLQRFQGEYRLGRRLYFIGSWDNSIVNDQSSTTNNGIGNFGGDIKYKYEF
ncbi:MAG: translocation/assembly module TamB, partial [Deltaproteobacteria bacterium]|nr:translocation/assembly module TamB [Deltaproteobacteria bacterium]